MDVLKHFQVWWRNIKCSWHKTSLLQVFGHFGFEELQALPTHQHLLILWNIHWWGKQQHFCQPTEDINQSCAIEPNWSTVIIFSSQHRTKLLLQCIWRCLFTQRLAFWTSDGLGAQILLKISQTLHLKGEEILLFIGPYKIRICWMLLFNSGCSNVA